jgi:hypothetical protein
VNSTAITTKWIVTSGTLYNLSKVWGWANVAKVFDNTNTYVVEGPTPPQAITNWTVNRVGDAKSLNEIANDISAGYSYVLYDPENWSFTPLQERTDPLAAIKQAEQMVAGKARLIVAPGLDLAASMSGSGTYAQKMLHSGIYNVSGAAFAVDIQSQSLEAQPQQYLAFLAKAKQQALATNPNVIVFAGISTAPDGQSESATSLSTLTKQATPLVNGFWLNIPGNGQYCPSCSSPNPQTAVAMLDSYTGK